jgi:hypothetical protein
MTPDDEKILQDFVRGSEQWLANLKKINSIVGEKDAMCAMCGIPFDKIEQLQGAVRRMLQELYPETKPCPYCHQQPKFMGVEDGEETYKCKCGLSDFTQPTV